MSTLNAPIGPLMVIDRASPWVITGQRFRADSRTVLDCDSVSIRIGVVGQTAVIEEDLAEDDSDPADPFWFVTLSSEQTTVVPSQAYEYVFVDQDGRVLLSGPCQVVDHTRPSA